MSKATSSSSLEDEMKEIESMFGSSKPKKDKKDKKESKEKKEKKPKSQESKEAPKAEEKEPEKLPEPVIIEPEPVVDENAVDIQKDMALEIANSSHSSQPIDLTAPTGDDGNEEIEFDGGGEDIVLDDDDVQPRPDYTAQGPTGAQVVADIIGNYTPAAASSDSLLSSSSSVNEPMVSSSPYSYQELLDRVYHLIQVNNPESMEKKRHILKPPQLMRIGTKKTLWVNFNQLCTILHRPPEHLSVFMTIELGTEGSIDASLRLVIRGKFVSKNISSLLRKYIREYVTCGNCKTLDTVLTRDNSTKLYFVTCQNCNALRSVPPIRAGFHAQTRDDRRNARR